MGLFQRPSSHRGGQPLSERRHLHNYGNNDQYYDSSNSSKKPPAGTKRRGLLGGLIRGRKDVPLSRQGPPPPSPPQPQSQSQPAMMQARSPTQIQSVPLPSPIQQDLQKKLQEAQQIEAFLAQTGKHKPTIGGSDIEFLFNNIATPTAAAGSNSVSTKSNNRNIHGNNQQGETDQRRAAREKAGNLIGRVDAILGSNNSASQTTAPSVQAAYGLIGPQSPHLQQQLFHQQQQQQHYLQAQRNNPQKYQEEPLNGSTHPQHVSNTDPLAASSVKVSNASTKKSKKGRSKKKGKRGIFSSKKEKEWGAFESEETYYQGMQALEEGRQFQNVANAFIQHFSGQDSVKSQSSVGRKGSRKKRKKKPKALNRSEYQQENNDDGGTIHTTEKSMGSTYVSSVSGILHQDHHEQQKPLKGILRTNGKFNGSVSVKSGTVEPTANSEGKEIAPEGNSNRDGDDTSEVGGYDIYKSTSTDEMFVGIRPSSDDSESTGLYTDENELIELRSALASTSDEASYDEIERVQQNGNANKKRTPRPQDKKEDVILSRDGASDYQQALASPSASPQESREQANSNNSLRKAQTPVLNNRKQSISSTAVTMEQPAQQSNTTPAQARSVHHQQTNHIPVVNPEQYSERQTKAQDSLHKGDPPIGPGRKGDPSPIIGGTKQTSGSTQDVDIKHSESSNSDSYKSIQERFAGMIQSVGTFHETQNQKIEEVKQSFISALTATPVAKNTSSTPREDISNDSCEQANKTPQYIDSAAQRGLAQNITCSNQSAVASFDGDDEVSKQDELYRQLMNAPSGENVEAAANLIRERSNNAPTKADSVTKTVEYFQAKRVLQREETQRLMSQPQFMTELSHREREQQQQLQRTYEDDPSLAELMDLNPSTSSGDPQENLRHYWEEVKQNDARKTRELIARTQIGTSTSSLTRSRQHPQETTIRNAPKTSPYISTDPAADTNQAFDDPPAIGRGSSVVEQPHGDGMMFSIETEDEDESLLQDSLLQDHAPHHLHFQRKTGPRHHDGPVPSAKSSFSVARSRQLSLVDSASTEEDMSVTSNDENNQGQVFNHNQNDARQIDRLLDRLETVEKRKYNFFDEHGPREDQTVEDEISEIKSILQGLKIQNQAQSKTKNDEEDQVEERVHHNHCSGESTASSSYVKSQLASSPAQNLLESSEMVTPRISGGDFIAKKANQYSMTTPKQNRSTIYDHDDRRSYYNTDRQYHSAPQHREQPAYYNHHPEPQQQFVDEPNEQGVEWPAEAAYQNIQYEYRDDMAEHRSNISYYGHDVQPDNYFHDEINDEYGPHYSGENYMEAHPDYHHHHQMENHSHIVYSAPAHQNGGVAMLNQSDDDFFYSRTESDITTSIALDPGLNEAKVGPRQCKSHRAATYFDTLSAGVKAVGSFDSVSDRYSLGTNSKKTSGSSTCSQTNTKNSQSSRVDKRKHSRSPVSTSRGKSNADSKKGDPGIRERIFRNAKDHIERLEKNGEISERNKARVLRFMDPLVGNSTDDDESAHSQEDEDDEPHTLKSYLPACHFFCG